MTAAAEQRPLPWELAHLVRLSLWTAVGLIVVLAGWLGVSGQAAVTVQFAWASLCILGLVISGLANIAWLLAGRRALGLRLAALTAQVPAHLRPSVSAPEHAPAVALSEVALAVDPLALVATDVMTRFHSADCPLVRGKDATASSRAQHQRLGRSSCSVCAA